jgi:hypothetical protein
VPYKAEPLHNLTYPPGAAPTPPVPEPRARHRSLSVNKARETADHGSADGEDNTRNAKPLTGRL